MFFGTVFLSFFILTKLTYQDVENMIKGISDCGDCEVKVLSLHIPLKMKLEDFDAVEIVPRDSKALGRKVFTAYFQKEGKNFTGTIFAFIDRKIMIPVAKRRIEKGERVDEKDFEFKEVYSTLTPSDFISKEDIEQKELYLKVPVGKGEVLRKTHLREDIAIRKGDRVKIVLNSGIIYVEFPGLALSNAKEGETVKVRNMSSNKIVYGVARENKIVEVK
jgi:flagella basal body P-ring formation protein FlgA